MVSSPPPSPALSPADPPPSPSPPCPSQSPPTNSQQNHTPTPAVPQTMLDHTAYPHIFDAILRSSPVASLNLLSQTGSGVRSRARALLFEHVLFLRDFDSPILHVHTGPSPHLHLATLHMSPEGYAQPDSVPELKHTRLLDSYNLPFFTSLGDLRMPNLHVVRDVQDYRGGAVWPPRPVSPPADVIVESIDATLQCDGGDTYRRPPHGTKTHIVHLSFEDTPSGADMGFFFMDIPTDLTIILHPYGAMGAQDGSTQGATQTTWDNDAVPRETMVTKLCDSLQERVGCRTTIVGLERLRPGGVSDRWTRAAKAAFGDTDSMANEGQGSSGEVESGAEPVVQSNLLGQVSDEGQAGDPTDNGAGQEDAAVAPRIKFETYPAWMARYAHRPEGMVGFYEAPDTGHSMRELHKPQIRQLLRSRLEAMLAPR